ncbi:hypothetical protein CMI37_23540 [Candidatus Pacearchaeota archaeon]|nr:hypothetical protein [Candidatus Pacearchaeota archaeon]|tara:strand:+ start:4520 stop:5398 length:879 start_codon:yes stop_codon:yes gene_type:complete
MANPNMPAIIPVAGMINDEFGMAWDASLMPVAPNYTAIESAIYECLNMGVSSIWIVANDDIAPLIRHRIGEWATDIDSIKRGTFKRHPSANHKEIPIYYVPIHPGHRGKVDNYAWSIIWGCNVAYWIMKMMSKWVTPDQYYISFPLGVLDIHEVYNNRIIMRKGAPSYFSHNGKTIKDGELLSFVLEPEEWRRAKHIITTNAAEWKAPEEGSGMIPHEKLPVGERRKSLKYTLQDVFGGGPQGTEVEINEFYNLTTWDGYVTLLQSELGQRMKRPSNKIMYRGFNNDRQNKE